MKRRILFTLILVIVVAAGVFVYFFNDNLRNSRIQLGSNSDVTTLDTTAKATNETGAIPFANPPRNIAFTGDAAGSWDIYFLSADGTLNNLTGDDPQYHDYFPSFSLDGTQINFIANRGADTMGPTQVKPDGTGLRSLSILQAVLVLFGENRLDWDPAWSPNGTTLLWSSLRDFNLELYVIPTDADFVMTNAIGLTKVASREWFGSWSPDGSQILFSSDRDGNENLFVVAAGGGETTQLTTSEFDEVHGMWSLDAQRIAFAYNIDGELLPKGELNLQMMNADGTNPQLLEGVFVGDPIMSPDGTQVAYVSNESGLWQIYLMNADGTNIRRITPDDGNYLFPVWQP